MLSSSESSIRSLEEQTKSIHYLYKENTGALEGSVDKVVWVFWWETVKSQYEKQIKGVRSQAKTLLEKLSKDVILSPEQQARLEKLKEAKLGEVNWWKAVFNTFGIWDIDGEASTLKNRAKIFTHTTIGAVEGAFDTVKFVFEATGKAMGILSAYCDVDTRPLVETDIKNIFSQLTLENVKKAIALIPKAIEAYSNLPVDEQADGFGKFFWNFLVGAGIWVKVAQGARYSFKLWGRAMRMAAHKWTTKSLPLAVAGATQATMGAVALPTGVALRVGEMDISPRRIQLLKKTAKINNLLETSYNNTAKLFHIWEDILRKNPDASPEKIRNLISQELHDQWTYLSRDQSTMLTIAIDSLEKAKKLRDNQVLEIFNQANVSIPKTLLEQQHILNANPKIQFNEWKRYTAHMRVDIETILSRNPKATWYFANKIWVDDIWKLKLEQKEQVAWLLEWWVWSIVFDLTSHPTSIIHKVKKTSTYGSSRSVGHMTSWDWRIYFNWHKKKIQQVEIIEHEYQHFLNMHFVEPTVREMYKKSLQWDLRDYKRFIKRWWSADEGILIRNQWDSAKDELASYMERNNLIPKDYYSLLAKSAETWSPPIGLYGVNFSLPETTILVLQELVGKKVSMHELVDIIRTSQWFNHMYGRLKNKYWSLVNFPNSLQDWKYRRINEILISLERKKEKEILSFDIFFQKDSNNTLKMEHFYSTNKISWKLVESHMFSSNEKQKKAIEKFFQKIDSLPRIDAFSSHQEIIDTMKYVTKTFWEVSWVDGRFKLDQKLNFFINWELKWNLIQNPQLVDLLFWLKK